MPSRTDPGGVATSSSRIGRNSSEGIRSSFRRRRVLRGRVRLRGACARRRRRPEGRHRRSPQAALGAPWKHGVPDPRGRDSSLRSRHRDRSRGYGRREPGGRLGRSGSGRGAAGVDAGRGRPAGGGRHQPKASVRITDADVSHPMELESAEAPKGEQAAAGGAVAGARVEVADYTQEMRADTLIIKGSLRNIGQAPAESVRLNDRGHRRKGSAHRAERPLLSRREPSDPARRWSSRLRSTWGRRRSPRYDSTRSGPRRSRPRRLPGRQPRRRLRVPRPPRLPGPHRTAAGACRWRRFRMRRPSRPPTARPATSRARRTRTTSRSLPAGRAIS